MYLIGEYPATIGEKNRVALPKRIREEYQEGCYITRGYENCLILVDEKRWNDFINIINKNSLLSLNVRDTKRFILGGAQQIEYDKLGRFVLPESLKNFANIENQMVFVGVGEWVEIWDESRWIAKLKDLSTKVGDIAEKLQSI